MCSHWIKSKKNAKQSDALSSYLRAAAAKHQVNPFKKIRADGVKKGLHPRVRNILNELKGNHIVL